MKKIKFVGEKKSKEFGVLIRFSTLKSAEEVAQMLTYSCDVVEVINDE